MLLGLFQYLKYGYQKESKMDSDSDFSIASEGYLNQNFPGLFNEEPEASDDNPASPQPGPSNAGTNNTNVRTHILL